MGESLRDQLLRSGLAKPQRERTQPSARRKPRQPGRRADPSAAPDKHGQELDLARAWALRERAESVERQRARAAAEAQARARKAMLQRLRDTLEGKALNRADAELVRHFEYGGKIRRVHVDAEQLAALNAGRLGVVQLKGSYVLVAREVAETVREFAADHVALLVGPDTDAPDDGVPDDLTW